MNIQDYKGVFVFIEQVDNAISNVALELIGKASELAKHLNTQVTAVVLGYSIENHYAKLGCYGADRVVGVDHPMLEIYKTEPYVYALTKVIDEYKPEAFLFGATAIGRDLAPRVSARVKTGLTADCTSLEVHDESKDLLMTRPAFGGNIMATIICPNHRPQMATVRPGVMKKLPYTSTATCVVERLPLNIPKSCNNVEILEVVKVKSEKINIQDADILISGGRGMGSLEGFKILEELATELGGTISSSRASVDNNWVDKDRQVGQTGKTVRPNLYIACGISGAIQHLSGMDESDFIIAINKDETAPIFDVADVGIIGDVHKVLPAFIQELKQTLS